MALASASGIAITIKGATALRPAERLRAGDVTSPAPRTKRPRVPAARRELASASRTPLTRAGEERRWTSPSSGPRRVPGRYLIPASGAPPRAIAVGARAPCSYRVLALPPFNVIFYLFSAPSYQVQSKMPVPTGMYHLSPVLFGFGLPSSSETCGELDTPTVGIVARLKRLCTVLRIFTY